MKSEHLDFLHDVVNLFKLRRTAEQVDPSKLPDEFVIAVLAVCHQSFDGSLPPELRRAVITLEPLRVVEKVIAGCAQGAGELRH